MLGALPRDPMESLAYSYITELKGDAPAEQQRRAFDVLRQLLRNEVSAEAAAGLVRQYLGTDKPAERLLGIIHVPPDPIPLRSDDGARKAVALPRQKTRNWVDYEDRRLLAAIRKYGTDNWSPVAAFVGNGRTRSQCSQRWNRGLDPSISKSPWTQCEEAELVRLVGQHGQKAWRRISTQIGTRSDVQCRHHFMQMQRMHEDGKRRHAEPAKVTHAQTDQRIDFDSFSELGLAKDEAIFPGVEFGGAMTWFDDESHWPE
jgi:hypothetical protein